MSDEGTIQEALSEAVESIEGSGEEVQEEEVASEEVEEVLEASEDAAEEESSVEEKEEEIRELKKKLKLKVDGQEIEEELDFNDDEALARYLQKAKSFDKKANELAEMRKQQESLFNALQENPLAVLSELGFNVDELSTKHIESLVEEMSKSPEQIAAEEAEKEKKELREELARLKKEKESAESERMRNEQASVIQEDIISALNNTDTILSVEDPEVISDIARAMYRSMQRGNMDVRVEDVIKVVESKFIDKLQTRLDKVDDKALEKIIGKKALDRARKRRLTKKKASTTTAKQAVKQTSASDTPKQVEEAEKQSYKDFFRKW